MDLSGLPQFTIDSSRQDERGLVLTGRLSHLRGVNNDGGWIYRTDRPAVVGNLSQVPMSPDERVDFWSPNDDFAAELVIGATYPWIDIYWQAYHITMVLAGRWEPRTFVAEPAQYYRMGRVVGWSRVGEELPEGAEDLGVRAGAWDHKHCELCNTHIGADWDPHGYVDPDDHWLCAGCYERYAVTRDVSFAAEG